jgi:hypothetical protein
VEEMELSIALVLSYSLVLRELTACSLSLTLKSQGWIAQCRAICSDSVSIYSHQSLKPCSLQENLTKNRASHLTFTASGVGQIEASSPPPSTAAARPALDESAAGAPNRWYGEGFARSSPYGKQHPGLTLASTGSAAVMSGHRAVDQDGHGYGLGGSGQGAPSPATVRKQAFMQSVAVSSSFAAQQEPVSPPQNPSASPGKYPVTSAALRELQAQRHGREAGGAPMSPGYPQIAAGVSHEYLPSSQAKAARQAIYTSEGVGSGMGQGAQGATLSEGWSEPGRIRKIQSTAHPI